MDPERLATLRYGDMADAVINPNVINKPIASTFFIIGNFRDDKYLIKNRCNIDMERRDRTDIYQVVVC